MSIHFFESFPRFFITKTDCNTLNDRCDFNLKPVDFGSFPGRLPKTLSDPSDLLLANRTTSTSSIKDPPIHGPAYTN
jgi:hypothetical protein